MTDTIIDWWRRRRWSTPRYITTCRYNLMSDVPELPPRRTVAIVGQPDRPKWLVFACPCGHAHRIAVNLSARRNPHWTLTTDDGAIGVWPSIDSLIPERRCHFWLKHGTVQWADDPPRYEPRDPGRKL
jgi:hypothetical protein